MPAEPNKNEVDDEAAGVPNGSDCPTPSSDDDEDDLNKRRGVQASVIV